MLLKYQQALGGKESMKNRIKKREGEWNKQKGGEKKDTDWNWSTG